jgi:hypothetical protein
MSDLDPADTKAIDARDAAKKERQNRGENQRIEDLKWLMADKRGRRIMWWLLTITGVFLNPFTGNSETFFKCGKQFIGQVLMADVNLHTPEKYETMVKEQTAK